MPVLALTLLLACTGKGPAAGADTAEDCAPTAWFADADGDSYGAGVEVRACMAPSGHVAVDGDCDDADPAVHPSAPELCNGVDDDCDGAVDPPDLLPLLMCYRDQDEDGWGTKASTYESCACPDTYATQAGDCNDDDGAIHPDAAEIWYDNVDQDCVGDEDFDADGDGWLVDEDCDDGEAAVHPDAEEICGNGIDDDCDGLPGVCGVDVEWDVSDARLEILSMNAAAYASPLGTMADTDGDGHPELALGWWTPSDQGCGPGETFFDVHVTSLAASGTEAAGDRSLARLVAPVDCRAWDASAKASGQHDLDGDGWDDLLVSIWNQTLDETTTPSRVYLVEGPVVGEIDLSTVDYVEQPEDWKALGNTGMEVVNTDLDGGLAVLVFSSSGDPAQARGSFLTTENFYGASRIQDAPTFTSPEGWQGYLSSVADVDGDGVDDMLLMHRLDTGGLSFAATYLGPLIYDLGMDDADGEIRTEEETNTSLFFDLIVCPDSGGGELVFARTFWENPDSGGSPAFTNVLRAWQWTDTVQDLGDAVIQITDEDGLAPMVNACTGDMDADGEAELVLTGHDDVVESGYDYPIMSLAVVPEPGTWDLGDLVRGQVVAPADRAWSTYPTEPPLISDVDFTGDGADDLVFGLAIRAATYEPEETGPRRTLMFPGSPAGL